jgi:Holliday junction resolvase RusA-like endonuclease
MSENSQPSQPIIFLVDGEPKPKQSYRAVKGGGYTDPRVKAWQQTVAIRAREAMQGREPLTGPVSMRVVFVLGNRRRVDLDNLNKGVSDAMNGIVFVDDTQVVSLHLVKHVKKMPGILVQVFPGELLPPFEREA